MHKSTIKNALFIFSMKINKKIYNIQKYTNIFFSYMNFHLFSLFFYEGMN